MPAARTAHYQAKGASKGAITNDRTIEYGYENPHFRILRGMTQKALGMAVGFPQDSADVRIAQYESGVRTPKQNLLWQMALALGVSPSALAVPRIKSSDELRCLLIVLEDECGIKFSPQFDNAKAIYESYGKGAKNDENL